MALEDHATVRVDSYVIPLIGVPRDATQDKCAGCGALCHIQELVMNEAMEPQCRDCQRKRIDEKQKPNA